jgi:hypothetical protein
MPRRIFIIAMFATAWLGNTQPSWSQGTIAYFQPTSPILLHADFFTELYPLDFDGDGIAELTLGYDFHFIGVRSELSTTVLTRMDAPPNLGGSVAPELAGFSIGDGSEAGSLQWFGRIPGAPYETDFRTLIQCFDTGCTGEFRGQYAYMGVQFHLGSDTHYGWVLLQISDSAAFGAIESWAWETEPGVPILAGAVPEPSPFILLLLSGATFRFLRKLPSIRPE